MTSEAEASTLNRKVRRVSLSFHTEPTEASPNQ
jgi:hypothetical protein